ncbi:TcaA second domain-containing protein [Alkalicoccus chagannorensis]|uniref:TcaA second domain-containing protein n=1 Tax=Alkalicoccus chagannorensis TaxID=427072 RepID=UPI000426586D|nr:zinc ribbon domain-containing protein [Alkalicoccus chagannorensis]
MKTCPRCGAAADQERCPSCGQDLPKGRRPGKWISFVVLGLLLAVFFGAPQLAAQWDDPDEIIASLEEAVLTGDAERAATLMTAEEADVTDSSAAAFVRLMQEDEEHREEMLQELRSQAALMKAEAEVPEPETYALEEQDGWLGGYEVVLPSLFFYMDGAFSGLEIETADERYEPGSNVHEQYGPLHPGMYEATLTYDGPYAHVNESEDLLVKPADPLIVEIDPGAGPLRIEESLEHMSLTINGEEAEVPAGEAYQLGALSYDGSIEVSGEIDVPGGTAAAAPVTVRSSQPIQLPLEEFSPELEEQLLAKTVRFMQNVNEAEVTNDPDTLTHVTGSLRDSFEFQIRYMRSAGYKKDIPVSTITVDQESLLMEEGEDGWEASVSYQLLREEHWYRHGEKTEEVENRFTGRLHFVHEEEDDVWLASYLSQHSSTSFRPEDPLVIEETYDWSDELDFPEE